MNWQPVVYCFSFGSLMASIVAGVFSPFCRPRQAAQKRAGEPKLPMRAALRRERAAAALLEKEREDSKDRARAKEKERVTDHDRIAQAMRQWSSERADADLSFVPPPTPPPSLVAEPAPEPETMAVLVERRITEPPPAAEEGPNQESAHENAGTIAEPNPFLNMEFHGAPNFYEILQISPRADLETIHRVYRIMAARFHPDNPVSGDHEIFLKLCEAYEVLSRPERRVLYDQALRVRETEPIPLFGARIFVDGLDGEMNRRFGMLALLYQRRRTNQGSLGISTLELESRMSLPREHLEFTLWYLRNKGYAQILEENSDYAITASGVDYVETNSTRNPILRELLTAGGAMPKPTPPPPETNRRRSKAEARRAKREGVILTH